MKAFKKTGIFIFRKNVYKKLICCLMVLSLITGLSGCIRYQRKDNGKLQIVTTLFPQYDFAKQIAGDKAEVTLLLKPGMEAHSYDLTPRDIVNINESDLFIYTGDNMETWAGEIIDSLERKIDVLDVSKGIELVKTDTENKPENEKIEEEEGKETEEEHVYDPHIWTSPENAMIMVKNIRDELIEIDPENEDYYRQNAENYLGELESLDNDIKNLVENSNTKTIYFADRFAMYYFTSEYGLDYVSAYDSCSSETEPSAKLVATMVNQVKKNNVKVIYYAELSNHKAADTISKETGAKELILHSCHNVTKDEMKSGATYLSLMRQNYENLKQGLE